MGTHNGEIVSVDPTTQLILMTSGMGDLHYMLSCKVNLSPYLSIITTNISMKLIIKFTKFLKQCSNKTRVQDTIKFSSHYVS